MAVVIGVACMFTPLLAISAAGFVAVLSILWGRPRLALVAWLLSVAMIPCWIGLSMFAYVPIQSLVAMMAIAAMTGKGYFERTGFDVYVVLFLVLSLVAVVLAGSNQGIWMEFALQWALSYFVARWLISATGIPFAVNATAIIFSVVGGLAVLELLLLWHPYQGWNMNNLEFATWGEIQQRGGRDRSEWAFGHSIALGGSLALALPFIFKTSYGCIWKTAMLLLMFSGILVSASRSALIAGIFALSLCAIFYVKNVYGRFTLLAMFSGILILTLSVFQEFTRGDTTEEHDSAFYRNEIYQTLPDDFSLFGKSSIVTFSSAGVRVGQFESIDSSFLYIGVNFGWLIVMMLTVPLVLCGYRLIAGRSSIAEVSLLGQIPLLATVALITQYQSLLFFVVGFAVQIAIASKRDRMSASLPRAPAPGVPRQTAAT
ncbi:hypothetical protein Rhow_001770 [Rhodococcus wratislaviensis]|uniref:O-antigen ligase-like membrane protein n=1 Tax=Rhodococcus wratislaviensis TaxID=44752 RepID=A0A402BYI3_RHOWR|nr:hypothetical protein [Rhodococcus wratislaviensis]GCE36404.1 hypothetical protein Rhow_001770 [Rhodococcus wratislaviensis]